MVKASVFIGFYINFTTTTRSGPPYVRLSFIQAPGSSLILASVSQVKKVYPDNYEIIGLSRFLKKLLSDFQQLGQSRNQRIALSTCGLNEMMLLVIANLVYRAIVITHCANDSSFYYVQVSINSVGEQRGIMTTLIWPGVISKPYSDWPRFHNASSKANGG